MSKLTQREFLWLDDAVNAAQLESKCFAANAQKCQDPAVKDIFNNCAQMHQRHFERLARYLTSAQGQTTQQTMPYQQAGYGYQTYQGYQGYQGGR